MAAYYYTTDRQINDDYAGRIPAVIWKPTNEHDRPTMRARIWRAAQSVLPERAFAKTVRVWNALRN